MYISIALDMDLFIFSAQHQNTLTKLLLPFDSDDYDRKEKKSFLCSELLLYASTFNVNKKCLGSNNSSMRL